MRLSEVARKAAEVMSERGHCKNRLNDDAGRVCYMGALNVAQHGDTMHRFDDESMTEITTIQLVSTDILHERGELRADPGGFYGKPLPRPVAFNNAEDVTGEEVILLLKETAARLEEEEGE